MKRYQLIVIGNGRLGLAVASQAVKWGADVALLYHPCGEEEQPPMASEGVDVYKGTVRFLTEHEVEVAGQARMVGKTIIMALNRTRRVPEIEGLVEVGAMTDEMGWRRKPPAKKWMVLGGTPQGVEWAQALARQGAQVTIVEAGDRLLPGYDPDCLPFLEMALSQEGIRVRCQTHVVKAIQRANKKIVQLRFDGWVEAVETDEILLAEADPPQVSQFGLERLGLAFIEGCLVTDEWMRTNSPHIYAVGAGVHQRPDCGNWPEEVRKVTLNALLGIKLGIDYSSVPRVIKTEPELVAIGMSEKQAKTGGNGFRVWRGYLTPEGAWAEEASSAAGLVKLITDDHGTILGIHAVGMGVSGRIQGLREAKRHKEKIFHLRRFQESLRHNPASSRGVCGHSLRFRLEDWVEQGIRACVRLRK